MRAINLDLDIDERGNGTRTSFKAVVITNTHRIIYESESMKVHRTTNLDLDGDERGNERNDTRTSLISKRGLLAPKLEVH